MKKFFKIASALSLGCVIYMSMVSCHSGNGEHVTITKQDVDVKYVTYSVKGIVVDQNGQKIVPDQITINGTAVNTGSTFTYTTQKEGAYNVVVKKAGYKNEEASVTLKSVVKDGVKYGDNKELTFYLQKEEKKTVKLGGSSKFESINLESTKTNMGLSSYNASEEDIVKGSIEVPAVSASEVTAIESQMGAGKTINDLVINITNVVIDENGSTRGIIYPGYKLADGYSFFTGMKLETNYEIDFSSMGIVIPVTFELPYNSNVRTLDAIKVFRQEGTSGKWTEVDLATAGAGIAHVSIVDETANNVEKFVINLNVLKTQSFALAMRVDMTNENSTTEPISAGPVPNTTSSVSNISKMTYKAYTSGYVINNDQATQGPLTDYLRKMVLRYYNLQTIASAQKTNFTYEFNPAYALGVGGNLYLTGYQERLVQKFSALSKNDGSVLTSFNATEYGAKYVYPYAVVPVSDDPIPTPTPTHGGGSND